MLWNIIIMYSTNAPANSTALNLQAVVITVDTKCSLNTCTRYVWPRAVEQRYQVLVPVDSSSPVELTFHHEFLVQCYHGSRYPFRRLLVLPKIHLSETSHLAVG
jgi:hypothetical protein